jgi:hypothetical protein
MTMGLAPPPYERLSSKNLLSPGRGCCHQVGAAVTRSGRAVNPPARFIEEIGATAGDYEIGLTASELRCCTLMRDFPEGEFAPGEVACVGAGLGGGFEHASELHVMKFKTAMATKDRQAWEVAVQEEHQRTVESGAWKAVSLDELPR